MNEQLRQQALEAFREQYGTEDTFETLTFPYYLDAWEQATERALERAAQSVETRVKIEGEKVYGTALAMHLRALKGERHE